MARDIFNASIGIILTNSKEVITFCNDSVQSVMKDIELKHKKMYSILPLLELEFRIKRFALKETCNENSVIYVLKRLIDDEVLYKKILEFSYDEICVTDPTGISIYCNSAFEKNHGIKRPDINGKNIFRVLNQTSPSHKAIYYAINKKKSCTIERETKTGKTLITTATPVFNNQNEIELVIANTRDITEIEKIKSKLKEVQISSEKYKREIEVLRKKELEIDGGFVAISSKMKNLLEVIKRTVNIDSTILIMGESGTGKSFIAKYIHRMSNRSQGPFITINCTTIPEHLLESELFGYASGAFTGAKKGGKPGLVELSDGGTLFLDEIGELPLNLQSKFLELIQERSYTPVGGMKSKTVDTRIIAATNADLGKLVKEKKFRKDLFYRLKVIELLMPSLRERQEDILPLINLIKSKFEKRYKLTREFSQGSINVFKDYDWPGNIRELEHVIEKLIAITPDNIIESHHIRELIQLDNESVNNISVDQLMPLDLAIEKVEKELILKAYKKLGSSYKVAEVLKISQSRASRKIIKYTKNMKK
ncbi:sigma-54 interaction domain-containing protein [Anaeromicrobium sediminis]|uniref:sigma-54 interaction domain-containing protein n=1 Tax=Anaeromicrobium sediminis TaxID=1478221 RepID=UPI001595B047|nr:sigma 54-interacting transcriptional regulator [Anaeromicrobium sediminis]